MRRKTVTFLLAIIALNILAFSLSVHPVKANDTIYIRGDGSIDPPEERILQKNGVYTFTDSIYNCIIVEKDNITINGNGYSLEGTGTEIGINLSSRSNVTIQNIEVKNFEYGIFFGGLQSSSTNNKIKQTNITENKNAGIYLDYSSNYNSISQNNIENNHNGIYLYSSSNNQITQNNIIDNSYEGISLSYSSSNNIIVENNIAINWFGINFERSSNNIIYSNNFLNNTYQTNSHNSINTWAKTDGSMGNYWSDYTGTDNNGNGLGDTRYVINVENQDSFPSMSKFKLISEIPTIQSQEPQPYNATPTDDPISIPEKSQQPTQNTPENLSKTIEGEEACIAPEKNQVELTQAEAVKALSILLFAVIAIIMAAVLCTAFSKKRSKYLELGKVRLSEK